MNTNRTTALDAAHEAADCTIEELLNTAKLDQLDNSTAELLDGWYGGPTGLDWKNALIGGLRYNAERRPAFGTARTTTLPTYW